MKAAHDALKSLLATDATFGSALAALNLGTLAPLNVVPKVLEGNQPFTSLGQEHFPAWFIEVGDVEASGIGGDDDPSGLVVGCDRQTAQAEIPLALVWHQQSPATAYEQRLSLHAIVTQLLLRNPTLNGAAQLAWLQSMNNDRQAHHPTHVALFRVLVLIETRRTP